MQVSGSGAVEKPKDIVAAMNRLHGFIERLEKVANNHKASLQPILRLYPEASTAKEGEVGYGDSSSVLAQILDATDRIDRVIMGLSSLTSHIDLSGPTS